jgi:hypothetical protein
MGAASRIEGTLQTDHQLRVTPPSQGQESDWVLVLDDTAVMFLHQALPMTGNRDMFLKFDFQRRRQLLAPIRTVARPTRLVTRRSNLA